jgi:hypothetical protein
MDETVVSSFFKELPICALDDVSPTDRAVRIKAHYAQHIKEAAALKSPSLKGFLENGQIPEFRNSAYVFSVRNEAEYAEVIILVRSWLAIFFGICHHPFILHNSVFCFKGLHDSNIKIL